MKSPDFTKASTYLVQMCTNPLRTITSSDLHVVHCTVEYQDAKFEISKQVFIIVLRVFPMIAQSTNAAHHCNHSDFINKDVSPMFFNLDSGLN